MMNIKIWLDDVRPAPQGYYWCKSVNQTIKYIEDCEENGLVIELLDLDHDLGEYATDGGDGIKLVDWLAETKMLKIINLIPSTLCRL